MWGLPRRGGPAYPRATTGTGRAYGTRTPPQARREIVSLCHTGLDVDSLMGETMCTVRRHVPYDRICWHTVDPTTLLFTSATQENLGHEPRLPTYEYEIADVIKWTYLARRPRPVGVLSDATHGHPEQSPRYRDLLAPRGIGDELRASFVSDGQCWGYLGLYRDLGQPGFDDDDVAFLLDIDAHIADGMRRALLIDAVTSPTRNTPTPGIVIVDPAGQLSGFNAAANELLDLLAGTTRPADQVPQQVLAIAAGATSRLSRRRDVGTLPSAHHHRRLARPARHATRQRRQRRHGSHH